MSEFEEILEEIGSFGPIQTQIFILVSLFEMPAAWGFLVHLVFASITPPWTCSRENATMDSVAQEDAHYTYTETAYTNTSCDLFNAGECTDVLYNSSLTTIVTEWDLVCDGQYITRLITILQLVGVLVGACVTGHLADMYGRKKVLFSVYGLFLLFGLVSAFANSWILYLVLRVIIGALFGGVMVVNFVLPLEFVGPKWRTFCGCIGFWACGLMSLALLAYLIPNWRHLTLASFAGGIPLLATWWFIPESPRWLLLKGRVSEAEKVLQYMAKRNGRSLPDLAKLQHFVEKEEKKNIERKQYSFWDLFRNFKMTKTTLIILYSWFVSSSVYYGTTLSASSLHGNRYLNFFLSGLVEIPSLIFVVCVNNRIGRRKTLSFLMILAGASCLSVMIVNITDKTNQLANLVTALAMVGKSSIAGAWAAAQVSSAEVFPTVVRNIGIGASSMAARVGLIAAPEIAKLDAVHTTLPYIIFGALGITCGLLCFGIPETLNKSLPDTLPPRVFCQCLDKVDPEEPLVVAINSSKKDFHTIDSTLLEKTALEEKI